MAANSEILGEIHNALANEFLDLLTNGIPVDKTDAAGNVVTMNRKPTAAEYSVIVAFLKANSITADIEENDALTMLKKKMEEKRKNRPTLASLGDPLDMH